MVSNEPLPPPPCRSAMDSMPAVFPFILIVVIAAVPLVTVCALAYALRRLRLH